MIDSCRRNVGGGLRSNCSLPIQFECTTLEFDGKSVEDYLCSAVVVFKTLGSCITGASQSNLCQHTYHGEDLTLFC